MVALQQFDVFLVNLDPTEGHEIKKTRPCVVVSPNELNRLSTVIIAPMTSKITTYPTRVPVTFQGKEGTIVIDQLRTVDRVRMAKKLGHLDNRTAAHVLAILQEMFR